VLSETISSYIAVGGLRNGGSNKCNDEFFDAQRFQQHQLFVGHRDVCSVEALAEALQAKTSLTAAPPLLTQDAFLFFTECTAAMVPALHLDVHHILRLCYLAEVIRVIVASVMKPAVLSSSGDDDFFEITSIDSSDQPHPFSKLVQHVIQETGVVVPMNSSFVQRIYRLASAYALPFLRKCTILMHVRYGIDFPATEATHDESESSRLSKTLRLPSLDGLVSECTASDITMAMVSGWIKHCQLFRDGRPQKSLLTVTLSHPAIFELIGLPKNFDTLQDEAMKRRCPTTGKDQSDPVVCLFCGEIFCSQAVCCKNEKGKGGCWQHREK
jgi:E3 ubiquitin-protein ligase UBR1